MITQKRLKQLLYYDPRTGKFINRTNRSSLARKGMETGNITVAGYREVRLDKGRYLCHRLAFLYMTGEFPKIHVDHINQKKSDNKWKNLREVTHRENHRNVKLRCDNSSGHVGVSWNKNAKKWMAYIKTKEKRVYLGVFKKIKDAIKARELSEVENNFHFNHGQLKR